jgi:N utilization substance protein B
MVSRRQIRIKVMQSIYAWYTTGDEPAETFELNLRDALEELRQLEKREGDKGDSRFMVALFYDTIKHAEQYEEYIKQQADNWELERMALMDRILLQMGICEILRFEDVPVKVTINEYLEISKRFSTPKSSKFINGVLDALHAGFRQHDMIHKSGRGLLDETPPRTAPQKRPRKTPPPRQDNPRNHD